MGLVISTGLKICHPITSARISLGRKKSQTTNPHILQSIINFKELRYRLVLQNKLFWRICPIYYQNLHIFCVNIKIFVILGGPNYPVNTKNLIELFCNIIYYLLMFLLYIEVYVCVVFGCYGDSVLQPSVYTQYQTYNGLVNPSCMPCRNPIIMNYQWICNVLINLPVFKVVMELSYIHWLLN